MENGKWGSALGRRTANSLRRCGLLVAAFVVGALSAGAVPARPGQVKTLTLADGTSVTARLVGDEHGHYWLAADGRAFRRQPGLTRYSQIDRSQADRQAALRRAQANQRRARRLAAAPRVPALAEAADTLPSPYSESRGPIVGQKRGLIILVNYADVALRATSTPELFRRIVNEENLSLGNFVGSVHDYFLQQSLGLFSLTFDVAGPVTLSKERSYYGGNDRNGDDRHPAEMVFEACQAVDSLLNFADYDWDGDGRVDQVYVIYAGKGEADGGDDDTVWPHEWELSSAAYYGDGPGAITLDQVTIDTYACGSELSGSNHLCGIGTMCHEFSHCLGYPDFYDTDGSGGPGMDVWDLMSGGSYNGDGYVPAGYTSYERAVAGWLQPVTLTGDTLVASMQSLQEGGQAFIMRNDAHPDEYFLLENRQPTGWDRALPGHGLLILHVDYNAQSWADNTPNDNPRHQRMTWVPADGQVETYRFMGYSYVSEEGLATDTYPSGQNDSFTNISSPAATLFNANTDGSRLLNKSVLDIREAPDGTISFQFLNAPAVPDGVRLPSLPSSAQRSGGTLYDLSGRRLSSRQRSNGGSPLPKGIYIHDKQKFVTK